jgi:hypothetical protein
MTARNIVVGDGWTRITGARLATCSTARIQCEALIVLPQHQKACFIIIDHFDLTYCQSDSLCTLALAVAGRRKLA